MTRQVTDQLYVELGYYYPEEFYVYIAEAEADVSCQSTMTCDAGKIIQSQADLQLEFTQTVTFSHIHGADLFAFSEAAIAVQVDILKDVNTAMSAVFDIATDFARVREIAAEDISLFDLAVSEQRSRDFDIQTQAAFSFVCQEDIIRDISVAVSSEFTFAFQEDIIKDFSSTLSDEFVFVAVGILVQELAADFSSEFTQTATISHIEGADLQVFNFASLTVEVNKAIEYSANLSSEFTQITDSDVVKIFDAALISESTISADAVRLREFASTQNSEFTTSTILGIVKEHSSNLSSAFDQTATISHIEGADMLVFNFSTLSVQLDIIRDGQSSISSEFATNTIPSRSRDYNISQASEFTQNVDYLRQRSFESQQLASADVSANVNYTVEGTTSLSSQANVTAVIGKLNEIILTAFSNASLTANTQHIHAGSATLSVVATMPDVKFHIQHFFFASDLPAQFTQTLTNSVERIRYNSSTQNSEFTQSAVGDVNKTFISSLSSAANQIADATKFRPFAANISSQASLTATISHIEGADIVAQSFANISAGVNIRFNITKALTSTSSIITNTRSTFQARGTLAAGASIVAIPYRRYDRPLQVFDSTDAQISTGQKKFGNGSLFIQSNNARLRYYADGTLVRTSGGARPEMAIELWFYPTASVSTRDQALIQYSDLSGTVYWTLLSTGSMSWRNGGVNRNLINSSTLPITNAWNHVLLVWSDTRISSFINGTRVATGTSTLANDANTSNRGYLSIGPGSTNADPIGYVDEFRVLTGNTVFSATGYSPTATTVNLPTGPFINDNTYTRFLGHYDIDFRDDVSTVYSQQASAAAVASVVAKLSGPVRFDAGINSAFTQTATISHIEGADIIVESFATLTTDVQKIKNVDSQQSAAASLTANFTKIVPIDSQITAVFTQSSTAVRTRDVPGFLQSNVTLTVFDTLFNFGSAALVSQFAQNTDINRTRNVQAAITDAFQAFVTARADIDDSVDLSSAFTVSADYLRIRSIEATAINSSSTVSASVVKTATFASSLAGQFTIDPVTTGTISANANISGQFAVQAIIGKVEEFEINQSTTSTLSATAANLIFGAAALNANAQTSATALRIFSGEVITNSIFSELFVVVKTGSVIAACDVVANVSATPRFDFSGFANLTALAQVTATDNRIRDNVISMSSQFTVSAEGTTDILGSANLSTAFTCIPTVNYTASITSNINSTSAVACDTEINRSFASLVMSAGTLSASISRTRPFVANLPAIAIELTLADVVKDGAATMTVTTTLSAIVRAVHIDDIVYKIPRETNLWKIESESREWTIDGETRIYVINRR